MREGISICIPTRDRVDLLRESIESCFAQDYRPLELVIGDDSDDSATSLYIEGLQPPRGVSISFRRNRPTLGQAANVNSLFERATGSRLVLLHDDDLFCPHGLDQLASAWETHAGAICVYGMQSIIDPRGTILLPETAAWNERYFRVPEHAGRQHSPLIAALWQQVPNNCYLVDAALARATLYRSETEVGQCVDAEFAIRLGLASQPQTFVMIDAVVSHYRLTPFSIARSKHLNRRQDLFFEIVRSVRGNDEVRAARSVLLSRISVGASLDAAMAGRRKMALWILFSRFYTLPLFSRWTLYRIVCTFSPALGTNIKRRIEGDTGKTTEVQGPLSHSSKTDKDIGELEEFR